MEMSGHGPGEAPEKLVRDALRILQERWPREQQETLLGFRLAHHQRSLQPGRQGKTTLKDLKGWTLHEVSHTQPTGPL